ncbi:MAG TPA: putative quinol monooxygenase [Acidobacteriota bacterium]|nr:putative quinol monooxygenase [Acidobacteriota bacterium]
MQVTVLAQIKAKPGMETQLRDELLALIGPTHSEEGCINYDLHQSNEDPAHFIFYENWKTQEDLDQHLKKPYLEAFLGKADEILAEPVEIKLFTRIG